MLKNLDPILNADLLHVLRSMGHGDELILADCNFPSDSVAAHTVTGKLIRLEGVDIPAAANAILSVFPLDSFVEEPVLRMEVVGAPDELVGCHEDMQKAMDANSDRSWKMGQIERYAFYDRARQAYAVVCAGGERRPYGCFVLVKGVIGPDGDVV
ncbi:MAG: RbsD/FucU family protein [bacterium]|jgi:L-fucose mutarotase